MAFKILFYVLQKIAMQEEHPMFYFTSEGHEKLTKYDPVSDMKTNSEKDENTSDCKRSFDQLKLDIYESQKEQKCLIPTKITEERSIFGILKTFCSASAICNSRRSYDVPKWFSEKQNRPNLATIEMAM